MEKRLLQASPLKNKYTCTSQNTLFLWDTTTSHLLGCLADIM